MKIGLYANGTSKNHGCEALLRTIGSLLSVSGRNDIINYCEDINDEEKYVKDTPIQFIPIYHIEDTFFRRIWFKILRKIRKNAEHYYRFEYQKMFSAGVDVACSIGGDNYCYDGQQQWLGFLNRELKKTGVKTALIGCSINKDILSDKTVVDDLLLYDLITVRETITLQNLENAGIQENVYYIPDSAFALERKKCEIAPIDAGQACVGINISPLILKYEGKKNSILKNYEILIEYILKETKYTILLIPHVVNDNYDDLNTLKIFKARYKEYGDRVVLVDEYKTLNAMELKYCISKCKYMIAARTHASIAAYSSCVPTIVTGYSVKAEGIAKDLFGTSEKYVLDVANLKEDTELLDSFLWLQENEMSIINTLKMKMQEYPEKIKGLVNLIENLGKKE
ncbi:MAG: polysaccharide pyruvyl transferase family protein [Clostridium sp.]|nr:polysaccharide pyruvyl transferase family protein [Clostridium sp.]